MASGTRFILALIGTTAMGLAMCVALIYGSLDRLSLRTAETNVDFMLSQLRDAIETNVGLGLPLAEIRIAQDLIEKSRASDEQVLAVEVFTPSGISLFNTDRGSIGELIPPAWEDAIGYRIANDRWRVEEFGNIVVGQVIRNDFGEIVGHLAVTISGENRSLHSGDVLIGLLQRLALVGPVVLALVWLVASLMLRSADGDFRRFAAALGSERPVAAATGTAGLTGSVLAAVAGAVEDFDRATTEVLNIDEAEDRDAA